MELETAPVTEVTLNESDFKRVFAPALDGLLGNNDISEISNKKLVQAVEAMRDMRSETRLALVEQARQFEAFVKKHDKLVVAHHTDADGLISAVLTTALFASTHNISIEEARKSVQFFSINNGNRNFEDDQLAEVESLREQGYTGLIVADLSPRDTEQLTTLTDMGYKLANIDHHGVSSENQPITARYNPEDITDFPDDVLGQMSTSVLFGMYPSLYKYTWLMKLGNKGDDSQMFDLIRSTRHLQNEEIDILEALATENFSMYDLANFLNVIGSTEQYNVSASQRDEYIRRLLNIFLSLDLQQQSSLQKLDEILRDDPEYLTRFNTTNESRFQTLESLLVAAEVAAERANEKNNQAKQESEILQVNIENGKPVLVIEGEWYRVIVHEIDTEENPPGSIIIGNMIKVHLNQLEKQAQKRRMFNDAVYKPTTVLLLQKRTNEITELGFYSTDSRLTHSPEFRCDALLKGTNKLGLTKGAGGHGERAGGDIEKDKVPQAIWHLVQQLTTYLERGESVPRWEYGIDGVAAIQQFLDSQP